MWYGQNKEDKVISEFFGDEHINLLSIGENTGWHISNCQALIKKGATGILVEPSPKAFSSLYTMYYENMGVWCFNVAIADFNGKATLYESGEHLGNNDVGLLSTLDKTQLVRWANTKTKFEETEVLVWTFDHLQEQVRAMGRNPKYDFINIDAEGFDLQILKQIDLTEVDCQCLCIEHNGDKKVLNEIREYCQMHDLVEEIAFNAENIILTV